MTSEVYLADSQDTIPGLENRHNINPLHSFTGYLIGFLLSVLLTIASFYIYQAKWIWVPSIPVALSALAIAQIGVHLVFFLHLTTGNDNLNNSLALAFGTLVVALVIGGTLWIMESMNHHMPEQHHQHHIMHETPNSQEAFVGERIYSVYPTNEQIGGTVLDIFCMVGQNVIQGQQCARIRLSDNMNYNSSLLTRLNNAESLFTKTNSELKLLLSESNSHINHRAKNQGRHLRQIREKQERLRALKARIRTLRDKLKADINTPDNVITIPFDGIVQTVDIRKGAIIDTLDSHGLFTIDKCGKCSNTVIINRGDKVYH